jgi:hypothetical protein
MARRTHPTAWIVAAALALFAAGPAAASDLYSSDTVSGVALLGFAAGSGEKSWLDRGLGKLRQGDGAAITADAIIAWRPSLTDRLGAVVTVQAQNAPDVSAGVGEAYLTLRPDPSAAVRFSARAGLFFPPVSLEHDGSEWSLVHTLSASAINSWVAEEVKTAGVEGKLLTNIAGRPAALTLAAFQGNDTAGALLFYRGWALHDVRSTLGVTLPLPTVPSIFQGKQAPDTRPIDEVDGRWGGYGKLEFEPTDALNLSLIAYDSNGDPAQIKHGQYAWRTRFAQLAARWRGTAGAVVLAQAMTGDSNMGGLVGGVRPASIGFDSAFLLVSQPVGRAAFTGRIDYFAVSDRTFKDVDNNAEHGWALTTAWTQPVSPRLDLVTEGLFIQSDHPDRLRFGVARRQDEFQLRSAIRFAF